MRQKTAEASTLFEIYFCRTNNSHRIITWVFNRWHWTSCWARMARNIFSWQCPLQVKQSMVRNTKQSKVWLERRSHINDFEEIIKYFQRKHLSHTRYTRRRALPSCSDKLHSVPKKEVTLICPDVVVDSCLPARPNNEWKRVFHYSCRYRTSAPSKRQVRYFGKLLQLWISKTPVNSTPTCVESEFSVRVRLIAQAIVTSATRQLNSAGR